MWRNQTQQGCSLISCPVLQPGLQEYRESCPFALTVGVATRSDMPSRGLLALEYARTQFSNFRNKTKKCTFHPSEAELGLPPSQSPHPLRTLHPSHRPHLAGAVLVFYLRLLQRQTTKVEASGIVHDEDLLSSPAQLPPWFQDVESVGLCSQPKPGI